MGTCWSFGNLIRRPIATQVTRLSLKSHTFLTIKILFCRGTSFWVSRFWNDRRRNKIWKKQLINKKEFVVNAVKKRQNGSTSTTLGTVEVVGSSFRGEKIGGISLARK